jgi:hypothetical protein
VEVVNEIAEAESPPKGETVIFPPQLIADYVIVASQLTSQRAEKIEPSRKTWYKNERLASTPLAECRIVM